MKEDFVGHLLNSQVLKFGEFKTKSGRMSPYFFNTGHFDSGRKIHKVADLYAEALLKLFPEVQVLYGPAYKGIPLCVSVSDHLSQKLGRDIGFTFNRKEIKDHGEGGQFIGHQIQKNDNVVIVEDVISAGTSLRESMMMMKELDLNIVGALVGVDRQEKGIRGVSARKEIEEDFGISVKSIVNLDEIVEMLCDKTFLEQVWINSEMKVKIDLYRLQYGA